MGLFSFLRRDRSAVTDQAPRGRRMGDLPSADVVRIQARRRLVGAAVLVVVAVLVLPWVFDSKPRPLPVDIPIDVPKRDLSLALPEPPPARASAVPGPAHEARPPEAVAPTIQPPAKAATQSEMAPVTEPPASVQAVTFPKPPAKPVESPKPEPRKPELNKAAELNRSEASKPSKPAEPAKAAKPVEPPKPVKPVDSPKVSKAPEPAKPAAHNESARAQAALEGRDAGGAAAVKFVVQVGAFEQAEGAREARQRVAKAGLQAHEATVQTADGKRIRVRLGPYASREEADKVAAKLRAAGVSGAVVPQ